MANRVPGVFNFSANFEALIAAPLDARGTVVNYSELTDSSLPYPYLGMVVAVTSDATATNNGLYILKGRLKYYHFDRNSNSIRRNDYLRINENTQFLEMTLPK